MHSARRLAGPVPRAPFAHPPGGLRARHFRFTVWICLCPFGAIVDHLGPSRLRLSTRQGFLVDPASHESSVAAVFHEQNCYGPIIQKYDITIMFNNLRIPHTSLKISKFENPSHFSSKMSNITKCIFFQNLVILLNIIVRTNQLDIPK